MEVRTFAFAEVNLHFEHKHPGFVRIGYTICMTPKLM